MTKAFSRLPTSVVPSHYTVTLRPDLKAHTFTGECKVKVDVKEEVKSIVCNASNLSVSAATVETDAGELLMPEVKADQETESLSLLLGNQALQAGPATVTYTFTGVLNDQMRGFYRSKYTLDGEERWAAVTQFESTDARQAFPCWDEPAVKATFDMVIAGPKDRVILSNMPEVSSVEDKEDSSTKVVTFATTPVMSTYLVAIVVGEFDYVEGKSEEGITCRVYSPKGKREQGQFAMECGLRALTFYSKFFGVPYPLTKYDMVAIPDFSSGAMENWGLVTYRETCVLVDSANSSQSSKQWVAIVVCHETAHQWFGNLVTMEWWTHLWLNEGFASFMENLTTAALYPEFKIWEQFVPGTLIEALRLDALHSSHPIEVEVGHPSEVDEIFDNISYNKGASVIRMLYDWIGDAAFKAGMSSYLTKYSYKNAETPQLWAELEAASGLPVTKVMQTWTEQMGFPCISMTSLQEGNDRILTLKQVKFVGDGKEAAAGSKWQVPVSIATAGSETVTKVMLDRDEVETVVRLSNVPQTAWVKLNPGVVGFFRVQYPESELQLLQEAVKSKSLPSVDRLNVLDDLFSLIAAGKAKTSEGLRLLSAYKAEDSYIVWNNISSHLSQLATVISDQDCYADFDRFVLDLFSERKAVTAWDPVEGESHLDTLLRAIVISRLGRAGDQEIRAEAKRRFDAHCSGGASISPDIRSAVYSCVASAGQADDYQAMLRLHEKADSHEEKERIARSGLAAFSDKTLLSQALNFSIGSSVRSQDSVHLIGSIAKNRAGRDISWQFFKENFQLLKGR
jgi:puromycin-sensitive aminopeptidase